MAATISRAALSSGLLARKGQARPAMRAQGYSDLAEAGAELGWNDLQGEDMPPVLRQRAALRQEVEAARPARVPTKISLAVAKRIQRETAHAGKAAFTLRLDEDRHLRLRLAVALRGGSAQQLVTQALDGFLTNLPDVEALVAHLPARKQR